MRVLLLGNASSVHVVRWANALVAADVSIFLLSLSRASNMLDRAVCVERLGMEAPLGYFAPRAVRRLLSEFRPDILHAHYLSGYGLLATLSGFHPRIVSVWGSDIFGFPKRSPLHAALARRILRTADRVLATSRVMAREVASYTGSPAGVTPFGVDTAKFSPPETLPSEMVIGTVRALQDIYGIDVLLRAGALLRHRYPDLRFRLLIVGDGPQRQELQGLATALGIGEMTSFVGRLDHDQVPACLGAMSIFVAPSRMDSFGVAVLEASACEVPVVVTRVGGLPEVVEEGKTGIIVPPEDPLAMAAAMARLAFDSELRLNMGRAGRDFVRRQYDWASCVDRMVGVYRNVI